MLARIRKSLDERDEGFTLIELLVVMIIIGILAAIAIPVFMNQRKKAVDTSVKADVSAVAKEIAAYYVDGSAALTLTFAAGSVTLDDGDAATTDTVVKIGEGSVDNTAGVSAVSDANNWCVSMENDGGKVASVTDGGTGYKYDSTNGLAAGNC